MGLHHKLGIAKSLYNELIGAVCDVFLGLNMCGISHVFRGTLQNTSVIERVQQVRKSMPDFGDKPHYLEGRRDND